MVTKSANKAITNDEADEIPEALQKFGKEKYLEAVKMAQSSLAAVADTDVEIRKLDGEILVKKEGNSHKLLKLAVKCVELTSKGKTAVLEDAALLFRDACKYAEEVFLASYAKAHPEAVQIRIGSLVPSWPVLKANFYGAMGRAQINPKDHVKPTEVIDAYKAWKSNPDNDVHAGGQGRPTGQGPKQMEAARGALISAEKAAEFTNNLKTAVRTFLGTCHGMTEEQQNKTAEMLQALTNELIKEFKVEDGIMERTATRIPPNPARESARS